MHDDKKQRKPGRKPVTADSGSKRTAQNRAAQRAFRERKQQYLKSLEDQVSELTESHQRTERENQELRQAIEALKSENIALK
ncbi:Bzip transcription factor Pap1 bound To Dna, partial [Coemansia reversa NRRL 1564]